MCRFVAYFGEPPILLNALLGDPNHSLIQQSHEAQAGRGLNADGFGMAWYDLEIEKTPGVFKSIQPAWNDNNLTHLAQKIRSNCFLAHVRASTVGDVTQSNCHPFAFGPYAFVHNGTIRHFEAYQRDIINTLEDELLFSIKGNTDSEYFFFLIMHYIQQGQNMVTAMASAIDWVLKHQRGQLFSRLNTVITNGREMLATRFVSSEEAALSLHYTVNHPNHPGALILSSEPLDDGTHWQALPENSYLYINEKSEMTFQSL